LILEPLTDKYLVVIAGPTAIGKTALAIALARHYQTDILSADSRQFFRELSIGTAKPTNDELAAARHYFVNSHSVNDSFNVGDFEKEGLARLAAVFEHQNLAILAGGSGLYIKAICEGFDEVPQADAYIRERLNQQYNDEGLACLQEQLKLADPAYYQQVDLHNPQRIIRALEVIESTGRPYSAYRKGTQQQRPFQIIKIGLELPRELLYERINQRVDAMLAHGLLDEVKEALPYRHLNALNTVGYTELFDYLDGKTDLDTAVSLIKQNTRRFAKRQLTWFRKDSAIRWFDPNDINAITRYIDERAKPPVTS